MRSPPVELQTPAWTERDLFLPIRIGSVYESKIHIELQALLLCVRADISFISQNWVKDVQVGVELSVSPYASSELSHSDFGYRHH